MTAHNGASVKFTQVAIAGVDGNNMIIQCNYVIVALDTEGRIWERPDTGPWYCVESPEEPAK